MKTMKTRCPMCGDEYQYMDIRNVPPTCGKRMCEANYDYQKRHEDPRDGYKPSPEDIKKW